MHIHVYDADTDDDNNIIYIPRLWLSMTTMVVEAVSVELTSEQFISMPLWLLLTAETISLDDTGLIDIWWSCL